VSTYPYFPAQHVFYCDAGGFPYLSLMHDFITLIENLPKIDRYHTSSIGNINTAQSLAISTKTSLKIFKQYKLKPSFSIIKDNKAKDKVGVGDKPPPSSFSNLIKFDPI
jgi:hypothetical protein